MIEVELRREGFERALELAREAAALDRAGAPPSVLAFLEAAESGDDGRGAAAQRARRSTRRCRRRWPSTGACTRKTAAGTEACIA